MTLHQRVFIFTVRCLFPISLPLEKKNTSWQLIWAWKSNVKISMQKNQCSVRWINFYFVNPSFWIKSNTLQRYAFNFIAITEEVFFVITGLFLEGASLDRKTGKLVESRPKVLYEQMPVIYIYAINTTAGKDSKLYECPIYRKPARTDLNYIGSIDFESDIGPRHWTMRGVALLCDIK